MAYKLANQRRVWWPTRAARGAIDPKTGEVSDDVVRVCYRIYTAAELREREQKVMRTAAADIGQRLNKIRTSANDGTAEPQALESQVQAQVDQAMAAIEQAFTDRSAELSARVVDWHADDFLTEDESGTATPTPFSDEMLALVLQDEAMAQAMQAALYEASRGARAKN